LAQSLAKAMPWQCHCHAASLATFGTMMSHEGVMGAATAKNKTMPISTISVTLVEMNGKQYDVEVGLRATVGDLKHIASPLLLVPVDFQALIIGSEVLIDAEELCDYVEDPDEPLQVSFYFSDAALHGESTAARCAAVDALTKVAHGGRKQVVDIFIALSRDDNDIFRHASVGALSRVAHLADARYMEAIIERLLDSNKLVAASAVQALGNVVEFGNDKAESTLLEFVESVEDQDMMLQLAAIEACIKLPQRYHRRVIRSLLGIFNTVTTARVRAAAKHTAAGLARRSKVRYSCSDGSDVRSDGLSCRAGYA